MLTRLSRPQRKSSGAHSRSRFGDHRPLGVIGQGGLGVVYLARQTSLKRFVAIKLVRSSDPATVDFLRQEATLLAELSHPHIISAYDMGVTEDGCPYLVMPFMAGGTLARLIHDSGPLSSGQIVTALTSVADALSCLHRRNIVHGDVKASNVLLSEDGEVFLGDLSVAQPNQTATEASDDILALGVLGRRLLKGALDVPEELISLIDSAASANPVERPEDLATWAAAVRNSSSPEPLCPERLDLDAIPQWHDDPTPTRHSPGRKAVATPPLPATKPEGRRSKKKLFLCGAVIVVLVATAGTAYGITGKGDRMPFFHETKKPPVTNAPGTTTPMPLPVVATVSAAPPPVTPAPAVVDPALPARSSAPPAPSPAQAAPGISGPVPADALVEVETPTGPSGYAVSDLDRDGSDDLVIPNPLGGAKTAWRGGQRGFHAQSAFTILTSTSHQSAFLADMDRDGRDDLVLRANNRLSYYRSLGNRFGPVVTLSQSGWGRYALLIGADINGDGWTDVLAREPNGHLFRYMNNGGKFGSRTRLATDWGVYNTLIATDLNRDGRTDVIARHRDGTLYKYLASRDSRFEKKDRESPGWQYLQLLVPADTNHDGYMDLLAGFKSKLRYLYRAEQGTNNYAPAVVLK